MVLLDTNILIEYYKGNRTIKQKLDDIDLNSLGVSAISSMELFYGARNKTELNRLKESLESLSLFHVTVAISTKALLLVEVYAKSHTLQIPDALIAATAIENNVQLFTLNVRDFQFIPEIELFV